MLASMEVQYVAFVPIIQEYNKLSLHPLKLGKSKKGQLANLNELLNIKGFTVSS